MFTPISIKVFLKAHRENSPGEDMATVRKNLEQSVLNKKNGAVCVQCGNPIRAIGSAAVEWNGCFACITGEADNLEDYEIDSVCFS
jgi:hypothetical protein